MTPEDRRAHFRWQYDTLLAPYDLGDELVAIDRATHPRGFAPYAAVPAEDPEGIWAAISACDDDPRTVRTYLRCATIDPATPRDQGRGDASWSRSIPYLWADIDTADGVHAPARLPLPTRAQAVEAVQAMPWGPPTALLDSGGGYYALWALQEPLDAQADQTQALLAALAEGVRQTFSRRGLHVDASVARDRARVLAPAGVRYKRPGEWSGMVESHEGRSYDPEEVLALCPEPEAVLTRRGADAPRLTPGTGHTPLDRAASTEGLLEVLCELQGLVPRRGDTYAYRRPDGSISSGHHASIREATAQTNRGGRRLFASGTRLDADWGMGGHAWTAADVLVHRWCGGDATLAARILARYEPDYRSVLRAIHDTTPAQLRERYPAPGTPLTRKATR